MLLIYEVTSSTDAKNYYAGSVASGALPTRQDYYSEGQERPGRFGGELARQLGLEGKVVDKATFDRLCDNLHPTGKGKLTPRTNGQRRVCYDFTFSGPKSFSVIEAFAPEEERMRIRQAFDESIDETVDEDIEPDMQARERRGGADYDVTTGNVLTAEFDHATARPVDGRPPDPHWHKHRLIWNATRTRDGRIVAGQFHNIVRDKAYYEAAFYARLAHKLEAMGYVIDRRGGKEWEIAGVPQSVIDSFSKRTDEIETEAAVRGIVDEARKARLGAEIRAKKQKDLTMGELRVEWDAQLTDAERQALAAVYRHESESGDVISPAAAVEFAIHHCFQPESVVPLRQLKRVALLHGLGSVTPEQIDRELPRHDVVTAEKDGRIMATTRKIFAEELEVTGFVVAGRGTLSPIGLPAGVEQGMLDAEQWAMVTGLATSQDRVNLVDAAAGVGKTTALQTFDQAMQLAGEHVTYLGTTGKSVDVLRKDGFASAETLAKFLRSSSMQDAARGGTVVVDESSILGHRDSVTLTRLAKEKDLRLIFLGDSRQHGSPTAGSFMRLLREHAGLPCFTISTIKRQKSSAYRDIVKLMWDGKTVEGFDRLDKQMGWVHQIAEERDRYVAVAAEYVQHLKSGLKWDDVLLISPTHAEGRQVVAEIRDAMKKAKLIGKEDKEFARLVPAELSEAERGEARYYRHGRVDVVQFFDNARGFRVGQRVEIADGVVPSLPFDQAGRFQAYRRESIKLAKGDILRLTASGKSLDGKHQLRNGSAYKIAGFTEAGNIRLDNGWVISRDFGHWKHGIETSIGAQGSTVKRTIVAQSAASFAASNMEQLYTSTSRSRDGVSVYTDDKAALRVAVARSSIKLVASDLIKPVVTAPPKRPMTYHEQWQHWKKKRSRHARQIAMSEQDRWYREPPTRPRGGHQPESEMSLGG